VEVVLTVEVMVREVRKVLVLVGIEMVTVESVDTKELVTVSVAAKAVE
jgi:hypothetical protein